MGNACFLLFIYLFWFMLFYVFGLGLFLFFEIVNLVYYVGLEVCRDGSVEYRLVSELILGIWK